LEAPQELKKTQLPQIDELIDYGQLKEDEIGKKKKKKFLILEPHEF
jgi:hypothetical protein